MRIINHGGFAALAILGGVPMIDMLLGPGRTVVTLCIFLFSTIGAAMWAQWVEGSPALLRPMGFYGGMLGAGLGGLVALFFGMNLWTVFAAVCIAAPWIQGIGRLRCLVQGCCHGRRTTTMQGICYVHPRTRVCRLTEFTGVPIHATQIYSILCNVVTGAALLRLYRLQASCSMICGVYLILSGAGIAAACAVAGAIVSTIHGPDLPQSSFIRPSSFLLALVCGATAWFVTGVDFPESSRRFARLT